MNTSQDNFTRKKKITIFFTYVLIAFIGCFAFPIIPTQLTPYYNYPIPVIMFIIFIRLWIYFMCANIAKILRNSIYNRKVFIFTTVFSVNLIGFLIRVFIEFGEATMLQELTMMNITIHVLLIPIIILITYTRK